MHKLIQNPRRGASRNAFPRGAWERGSRAYTLLETTVALAILAAGFVLTAQILTTCAKQRQAAGQLLVAQLEAANALERIAAMPFASANAETLGEMKLSSDAQAALVGGELTATIEEPTDDGPPHKRIRVEVTWPLGEGPRRTVELTAWKYNQVE